MANAHKAEGDNFCISLGDHVVQSLVLLKRKCFHPKVHIKA